MDTITGTVVGITRHGHTVYGNPIISVDLRVGENTWVDCVRISDNANLANRIDNPEFREQAHTFALTKAGRISHVVRS